MFSQVLGLNTAVRTQMTAENVIYISLFSLGKPASCKMYV